MKEENRYRVIHGSVYEQQENGHYLHIYKVSQLVANTSFDFITIKNVAAAIDELEMRQEFDND